ncbi:MAG: hypothetical protein JWM55_253 [Acidimicrobiaceae bacterium]|nr:hypothetical protein [Acidimicrobiaceae bacterium]
MIEQDPEVEQRSELQPTMLDSLGILEDNRINDHLSKTFRWRL